MRFTQAAAQNDPFELRPVFDTLSSAADLEAEVRREGDPIERNIREQYRHVPQSARGRLPYAVFARKLRKEVERAGLDSLLNPFAATVIDHVRPTMLAKLQNDVGILSLTERPDNMAMWAHYAANHGGLLFEFNAEHVWFSRQRSANDEFYRLRQVRYTDLAESVSTFRELDNRVLFTKQPEWAYEAEWRILAPIVEAAEVLNTAPDPTYLFDLDPEALCGVVVGARSSSDLAATVITIIRAEPPLAHVEVRRALLDPVRPTVRYELLHG